MSPKPVDFAGSQTDWTTPVAVTNVAVSNFKSFRTMETALSPMCVLIGANAAGKSNFIEAFRFVQAISDFGLANAISLQGGAQYLPNIRLGPDQPVKIKLELDTPSGRLLSPANGDDSAWFAFKVSRTTYQFELALTKRGSGVDIVSEELVQDGLLHKVKFSKTRARESAPLTEATRIRLFRHGRSFALETTGLAEGVTVTVDEYLPRSGWGRNSATVQRSLLLEQLPYHIHLDLSVFDIDPKAPKRASPITGKAELEPDGSNLAIVLGHLLQSRAKKRKLTNLVTDLLPFVDGLGVETFADKSLLFKIREKHSDKRYLPASLLSDGTISLAAIIVALYFQPKHLTVIEEIERNLHPAILGRLVEHMYDAAADKQILASTHHPELIKHVRLSDLLLVTRDDDGFSELGRAADLDQLGSFLTSSMGIDDLYVQGVLEALAAR
jgi:predicted ATPase